MVEDANDTNEELIQVAKKCTNSAERLKCYQRIWDRKVNGDPHDCLEFVLSLPAVVQLAFEDKLVELWVKKKGADGVKEMLEDGSVPASIFGKTFFGVIRSNPEAALALLRSTDRAAFSQKCGPFEGWTYWMYHVVEALPASQAIDILLAEPPSHNRETRMERAIGRAVEEKPEMAQQIIASAPHMIFAVASAAETVSKKDPIQAAAMLNAVPGEILRTSIARKAIRGLPAKEGLQLIEALSNDLTRESVRKTYLLMHTKTPPQQPK